MKQIFDAFGTEVKIGDWIYYIGKRVTDTAIGRIYDFTSGGTPRLEYIVNNHRFNNTDNVISALQRKYTSTIIHRAFIKCYNQALIESLEKLIK